MIRLIMILSCLGLFCVRGIASTEIVYNGGFETGDFTGWILSGNPIPGNVDTSNPHSGNYAANLFAAGSLGYMEQFLSTTPGVQYDLTYFLESDGGTPNEFLAQIGGKTVFDQTDIPSQKYTLYSFSFRVGSTPTDLKFGFRDDPGSLHLDDVSVTPVPEPAFCGFGFSLIGLAAIAAQARRSRRRKMV